MKKRETISYLNSQINAKTFTAILLFLIVSISFLSAQNQEQFYLTFNKSSSLDIIKSIEEITGTTYNFSHSILPNEQFSFSVNGNLEAIHQTVFSVLDRHVVHIEDKLFAIQDRALQDSQKIAPHHFIGTITNELSETLPFARISISATGQHFESDLNGVYDFNAFVSKEEMMNIHFLGYQTLNVKAGDLLGQRTQITLQQENHILGEIVIKDYLKPVQVNPLQNADIIDPSKITSSGQADLDAFSISQLLPGVYNAGESLTDLQIRGGPPDQVSYNWNNIQLFQNSLFYGRVSAVNPFMIDKVTVNRNGASSSESGQVSGSIHLRTDSNIDSLTVKLHHDLLYTNIGVAIPLLHNKVQIRSAYRVSNSHLYRNFVFTNYFNQSTQEGTIPDYDFFYEIFNLSDVIVQIPDFTFSDLTASLDINLSTKDQLNINYISVGNNLLYGQRSLDENISELAEERLAIHNNGYSVEYTRNWSKHFKTTMDYSVSNYAYNTQYFQNDRTPEDGFRAFLQNEIGQSKIKFNQQFSNKWFTVDAGYQYEDWHFNFDERNQEVNPEDNFRRRFSNNSFEHSAYLKSTLFFSPLFKLESGVRWSSYSLAIEGRDLIEPRVHLSVVPTNSLTLHMHYGKYHQNLTREESFSRLEIDNSFWYLSDETTESSALTFIVENQQYSLGAKWNTGNWTFHADIYQKEIQNLHSSSFDFSIDDNPYIFNDLSITGLELSAQFAKSWLKFLWTYDYIDESLTMQNDNSGLSTPSPFSQPHRLSLYQDAQWGKNQLSVQWNYATGRLFSIPDSGNLSQELTEEGDVEFFLQFNEILTTRVRDYHRLDLSYHRSFTTRALKGKLGFHILNVYNRNNVLKNNFFIDFRTEDIQLGLLAKTGLGITPNVSLDIVF